jgi:hypothetical protein
MDLTESVETMVAMFMSSQFWRLNSRRRGMLNWNEYRNQLFGRVAELSRQSHDTVPGPLSAAGKKTARLGDKTCELISLAVTVTGTTPSLRSCAASLRASLLLLFRFGGITGRRATACSRQWIAPCERQWGISTRAKFLSWMP